MSRARAQRWIADGLVSVDETRAARSSVHVREGAAVELPPAWSRLREEPGPEDIALYVLYEDDDLMAINKPAGMVVHPSFRNVSGTVLNGVLWRLRNRKDVRPGLVSRLDKDTSGVVVIALSPGVHARIQRDTRAGRVTKKYLAIVHGTPRPAEGAITLPLAHDPGDRRRIVVSEDGAERDALLRGLDARDPFTRAMRARHGANASNPSAPCRARMAHRRRLHVRLAGSVDRAAGAACVAHDAAASEIGGTSDLRSSDGSRYGDVASRTRRVRAAHGCDAAL